MGSLTANVSPPKPDIGNKPLNKKDLLQQVTEARTEFMAALEALTEDEMLQPGADGIWSVKDIMAHLIVWEAEVVTALSRKLSGRYQDAPNIVKIEDVDDWNADLYQQNAGRPLAIILDDFQGVHKHLLIAIQDLDNKILSDPLRFEWMEGEPLAYLVLEVVVWHEQEHATNIRQWHANKANPDHAI